jgi:hypothetical protein
MMAIKAHPVYGNLTEGSGGWPWMHSFRVRFAFPSLWFYSPVPPNSEEL